MLSSSLRFGESFRLTYVRETDGHQIDRFKQEPPPPGYDQMSWEERRNSPVHPDVREGVQVIKALLKLVEDRLRIKTGNDVIELPETPGYNIPFLLTDGRAKNTASVMDSITKVLVTMSSNPSPEFMQLYNQLTRQLILDAAASPLTVRYRPDGPEKVEITNPAEIISKLSVHA